MTLDAHEFIRRFLLHGLPDGFHRIRHYGFLANGQRVAKLALIRGLPDQSPPKQTRRGGNYRERLRDMPDDDYPSYDEFVHRQASPRTDLRPPRPL